MALPGVAAGRQPPAAGAPAASRGAWATTQPLTRPQQLPRWPAREPRPAAALPPDALDALPTAAAAAAASLLTAAWLRPGGRAANAAEQQEDLEQPEAQQEPEPPGSPEAVWAAAWQGFAPPPAAPPPAAEAGAAAGTVGERASSSGQSWQAGDDAEEGVELQQASLQRSPVLLLEGIRAADRSRLLALCLAALEAQVAALPAAPGLLAAGPAQWRQLAAALLALSSVAAAAAWLGYVPARLLEAAAAQLASVDAAVLQTAGLQAAAAKLQQQAAAAKLQQQAAAASSSGSSSGERAGGEVVDASMEVAWYCLDEKLHLYSSVLRLLSCASIAQQQAAAAGPTLLSSSVASSDDDAALAAAGSSGSSSSSGDLVRQQARSLLLQQQAGGSAADAADIRGWRATAAGTRSETQLLALAPAALQDMAVTAADAVAAAYLADAAAAGPSAVARQAAAVSSWPEAGVAVAFSVTEERQEPEEAGRATQQQQDVKRQLQRGALAALRSTDRSKSSDASSSDAPSSDARPLEAGWWPTFVHRQLASTRQLQRFTNGVALQRWLYRQYRGVVDIYEDRLQLWAFSGGGRRLEARSAPMKRTPELGRLSGLRYAASLLLEAADLLMPLLRTLWRQATSAASWVLVRLLGQAVALVRRGVQQGSGQAAAASRAARGKPGPADEQQQVQQQRRRGARRRQQAGQDSSPEQQPGGSQPSWAWEG